MQRNRKVWPIQRKSISQSVETIPDEGLMADILDKDLKTNALKILKNSEISF